MTTPFDTQRLDEECERIASEIYADGGFNWFTPSYQWDGRGPMTEMRTGAQRVRDIILDRDRRWGERILQMVFSRCRRPRMVSG